MARTREELLDYVVEATVEGSIDDKQSQLLLNAIRGDREEELQIKVDILQSALAQLVYTATDFPEFLSDPDWLNKRVIEVQRSRNVAT